MAERDGCSDGEGGVRHATDEVEVEGANLGPDGLSDLQQQGWEGDDYAQVDVDRGSYAALKLEAPELHRLRIVQGQHKALHLR